MMKKSTERRNPMNIYDFDGTLYDGDSTFDFLKYSIKKHPSLIRFQAKERFYRIFTGYDAEGLLEEFWDCHQHKIFPWYADQQEETDIVISASPEFILNPICARLGIRTLMASRVDSKTGKYQGLNCWGDEKVRRLKEQTGISHCDKFFSDSHSDQPLANIADAAFLVKNGKILPWN